MVAVFCISIGSKVRVSASAHFGIIFRGLPIRERRLATRTAIGAAKRRSACFGYGSSHDMHITSKFFPQVYIPYTQVFNTGAEFITHFLNFPARAIEQWYDIRSFLNSLVGHNRSLGPC